MDAWDALWIFLLSSGLGSSLGWIFGFNAGWYRCFNDSKQHMPVSPVADNTGGA